MNITGGSNFYVDPKKFNDVESTVRQFTSEINQKSLQIGQQLDSGKLVDCYKGTLLKREKSDEVVIKMLKVYWNILIFVD